MSRRTALLRGLLSVVAVIGVLPSPAAARTWPGPGPEPSAEDLEAARTLYEEGGQAIEEDRHSEGLELFERSYRLSGASSALFAIGYALRGMGRATDARDAFNQLLLEHPDVEEEFRRRAEGYRDEMRERVAVLELRGLPEDAAPVIALDGQRTTDSGERPLELETDPGEHRLRVEADGYQPFEWQDVAPEGGRIPIDVNLVAESAPVIESPWLWAGIGAAVVATAVIVAVVLQAGAQLEPRSGTISVEL